MDWNRLMLRSLMRRKLLRFYGEREIDFEL